MYLCFYFVFCYWFMCFGNGVLILKMRGVGGEVLPKAGAFGTGQIWLSTAQPSTLEETPRQF